MSTAENYFWTLDGDAGDQDGVWIKKNKAQNKFISVYLKAECEV